MLATQLFTRKRSILHGYYSILRIVATIQAQLSLKADLDCALPGNREHDAPSIVLPHQDASYISHIALDIGGSLIKLVYFSSDKPDARSRSENSNNQSGTGGDLFTKTVKSKL